MPIARDASTAQRGRHVTILLPELNSTLRKIHINLLIFHMIMATTYYS